MKKILAHRSNGSIFARAIAQTIFTGYGIQILGLATGLLLARTLHPEGRGILAAATIWASLVVVIAAMGVPEGTVYFLAKEGGATADWLVVGLRVSLFTGFLFTPVALLCSFFLSSASAKEPGELYAAFIPVSLLSGWAASGILGLRNYKAFNVVRTVVQVATAGLLGLLAIFKAVTPTSAILAYAAAEMIQAVTAIAVLRRLTRAPLHKTAAQAEQCNWVRLLRFGVPAHLGVISSLVADRGNQIVLVSEVSVRDLGLFVAALAFSGPVLVIGQAVSSVALAELTARAATGGSLDAWSVWRSTVLVSAGVASAIGISAGWFVPLLLGEDYSRATHVLRLILAGAVVNAGNRVLCAALRASHAPGQASWGDIVGVSVSIPLMILLVGTLGVDAAPLSSFVGYTASLAFFARRLAKVRGGVAGFVLDDYPIPPSKGD